METLAELPRLLLGSLLLRPYVFAFLAAYLLAGVLHLGWRKTLQFTAAGYLIAFASEYCSINTGFPYGWYYYVETTRSRELWIAGVPFFDSLSYVFLAYCSYSLALFAVSPLQAKKRDLVPLETMRIRRSFAVLLLGSLFQVFLDIVIDPVALQGERWFLGRIYGYREAGMHFGVPLSNYLGWWLVSFVMIGVLQRLDTPGPAPSRVPFRALLGPLLYVSVLVFNISVAFYIGERLMPLTSILIVFLPAVLIVESAIRRTNRYTGEEIAEHLRDFPPSAERRGEGLVPAQQ